MKKIEKYLKIILIILGILVIGNIFLESWITRGGVTAKASSSQGTIQLFVETPSLATTTPPAGGGGGGGAGLKKEKAVFSVEPKIMKIMVKKGETFKTPVRIKNTGKEKQNFQISQKNLDGLVLLSDSLITLNPDEEKIAYATFLSTDDTKEGVYTGKIIVSSGESSQEVLTILEVKSKKVLFDVSLSIPSKYKEILPGEDLFLQITLFNLGDVERADVSLEYQIKDFEGNMLIEKRDVVAVETQASFSRSLSLPKDTKPGDYAAVVYAKYGNSVGTSSEMFRIAETEKKEIAKEYIILSISIFLFALIAIMFYKMKAGKKTSYFKEERDKTAEELIDEV